MQGPQVERVLDSMRDARPRRSFTGTVATSHRSDELPVVVAPRSARKLRILRSDDRARSFLAGSERRGQQGRHRGRVVLVTVMAVLAAWALWPEPHPGPRLPPGDDADVAGPTTRSATRWPFSSDSIWNTPIGSGATFADPHFFQPPNGYSVDTLPIVMSPQSPLRPVYSHEWPARCHRPGDLDTAVSLPVPDAYVVAPDDGEWQGLTPNLAGGVLLADGRTVQEFNYFARCEPGGPLSIASGGLRDTLDLYGNGRPDSFFGGHGGSGLSGVGGAIRLGELTGPEPIRHATKLLIDMTRWGKQVEGANSHRWPAYAADSDTSGQTYGSNATGQVPILEMGSLLAIPGSVDLDALGLETKPARRLAGAWQDYGAYVVDNAGFDDGWGQNLLAVEHGVASEMLDAGISLSSYSDTGWADTPWNRDMNRLFEELRQVTNNTSESVGGGGVPRRPLAPPLDVSPGGRR